VISNSRIRKSQTIYPMGIRL